MTRYTATIRHHSIATARHEPVGDTLTQAKRNATREFGSGFIGHEIVIFDTDTGHLPLPAAFRTIGADRWTNASDRMTISKTAPPATTPTGEKTMTYEITGGDHGNYKITEGNAAAPVAFVRRNQTGGGYTVRLADESKSVQMRNMPPENQAFEIMMLFEK